MNKAVKIIAGVVLVVIVVAALAIALSGPSHDKDYDYETQAKQEIDKYGFDSEIVTCDVESGTNAFGVSIIRISGTFTSDGAEHSYVITTDLDHELYTVQIDGHTYWGDGMGDAEYDFRLSDIGPFEYVGYGGYTYTEEPEDGMKFVMAEVIVRNAGNTDGMSVSAPDLVASDGNSYTISWSATSNYSDSYDSLSGMRLAMGNTVTFQVIYEIPEGLTGAEVRWDSWDLDLYGYVHVPGLLGGA